MLSLDTGVQAIRRLLCGSEQPSSDSRAPTPPRRRSPTPNLRTDNARLSPPCWRTAEYPPEVHAARLFEYLVSDRRITGNVLFEEMLALYWEMTAALNWAPRPWNPVGRELCKLLGGKKTYAWFDGEDGLPHRLRVYRLSDVLTPDPTHSRAAALMAA